MGHSSFGPMWPNRNPNIVKIEPLPGLTFPGGVHRELADLITLLVRETARRGYEFVPGWCWGYANRAISGTNTASNHSQGTSIDINAPKNPYSYTFRSDMPSWMPELWKRFGFRWGGNYSGKKDPMHYEFMGTVADARRLTIQARNEFNRPTPPPQGDWFDMASKQDLEEVVRSVIGSLIVQVEGDGTGATFVLSKATATLTWLDDEPTATMIDFIGAQSDNGRAYVLGKKQLGGMHIVNRADLEKAIGRPYTEI